MAERCDNRPDVIGLERLSRGRGRGPCGLLAAAGLVAALLGAAAAAAVDPLAVAAAHAGEARAAGVGPAAVDSYRRALAALEGVGTPQARLLGARIQLALGAVLYQLGRTGEAVMGYQAAVAGFQAANDRQLEIEAQLALGAGLFTLARYEAALSAALAGLRLAEVAEQPSAVARACHLAAMVHRDLGHGPDARELLERAVTVARQVGDPTTLVRALNELGNVLHTMGDDATALERKQEALALARQAGDEGTVADCLNDLAILAVSRRDDASARRYLEEAYAITIRSGGPRERAIAGLNLAGALVASGEIGRARELNREALRVAREAGLVGEEVSALVNSADIEASAGSFGNAYEALRSAYHLRQEIVNRDAAARVADLQALYQAERREAEIRLLTSERAIQELTLERERAVRRWWVAGFAVAVAFALLLGAGLRLKARSAAALRAANAKVEDLARTDTLTGLANRRHLLERLDHELRRSERGHSSFSIVMLDLDDFKRINDSRGHACGDRVLAEVGALLIANVRALDVAGRWGGEEFLLILPGTDAAGAAKVAEKIRLAVTEARVDWQGEKLTVSATLGVAECPDADIERCLREADDAMYRGKQAGKNRVVVA